MKLSIFFSYELFIPVLYKFLTNLVFLSPFLIPIAHEGQTKPLTFICISGLKTPFANVTPALNSKINNNLDRFHYNVIIANIYEIYNFLNQSINGELNSQELRENYTKILSVLLPIVPHYASECLNDLNDNIFQNWPQIDKKMLQEDYVEYVVQINGKKRAMIKTNKDISQEELISKIKNNEKIKNIFENKIIDKSFFVKNRLINILIK